MPRLRRSDWKFSPYVLYRPLTYLSQNQRSDQYSLNTAQPVTGPTMGIPTHAGACVALSRFRGHSLEALNVWITLQGTPNPEAQTPNLCGKSPFRVDCQASYPSVVTHRSTSLRLPATSLPPEMAAAFARDAARHSLTRIPLAVVIPPLSFFVAVFMRSIDGCRSPMHRRRKRV